MQPARDAPGCVQVVAEQTFDPLAHVFQAAGGIGPGTQIETDIAGAQPVLQRPAISHKADDAGDAAVLANPSQPLFDQDAVVISQPHHVRHRAECDQVEELGQIRFGQSRARRTSQPLAIAPATPSAHKSHAHAREMLAGKVVARLVGVDDCLGGRQGLARRGDR